jgi:hypothetical protein
MTERRSISRAALQAIARGANRARIQPRDDGVTIEVSSQPLEAEGGRDSAVAQDLTEDVDAAASSEIDEEEEDEE